MLIRVDECSQLESSVSLSSRGKVEIKEKGRREKCLGHGTERALKILIARSLISTRIKTVAGAIFKVTGLRYGIRFRDWFY